MSWQDVEAFAKAANITIALVLVVASAWKLKSDPLTAIYLVAAAIFISI